MLDAVSVILVRPRFPENIGMVARAMGNLGAGELILVRPERWEKDKAAVLATSLGQAALDSVRLADCLEEALAPFTVAIGSTARTGGWRRDICGPEEAARKARAAARRGGRVALVMGPEDTGLNNAEVELCTWLVNIPTVGGHSSLNLAQATLILLYECMKADQALSFQPGGQATGPGTLPNPGDQAAPVAQAGSVEFGERENPREQDFCSDTRDLTGPGVSTTPVTECEAAFEADPEATYGTASEAPGRAGRRAGRFWTKPALHEASRRVTLEEEILLIRELQNNLIAIDHLPADNSDWFMKTMRRFLRKKGLRRNEFDMLMGICRQIRNKIS